MSDILSKLKLSAQSFIDGLVSVHEGTNLNEVGFAEQRILQEVRNIDSNIDYVFFRRFLDNDIRTSHAVACVVDNCAGKLNKTELARLHRTLWLNGTIPLLYVDNADHVDILSCLSEPASKKAKDWEYKPIQVLSAAKDSDEQLKRFSAYRLADGTFWEDEANRGFINIKKAAHNVLIEKVKTSDRQIDGDNNPIARRLLLLMLLIKYLEDRGVFKSKKDFFSRYTQNATSFIDVLKNAPLEKIKEMFALLEDKFNGDIFTLEKGSEKITQRMIKKVMEVVSTDKDSDGQLYLWNLYNFEHIPVEVISHIYQYFTEKGQGAVFTPVILVNLMLDQVMPLNKLTGSETVFDPTCGSGIFLVSAFRRLVYIQQKKQKVRLSPKQLVDLLKKTIYGIELQEEAAHISCFSLALAVCDSLLPEIIWQDLHFENLIDNNIFIGDFGKRGADALSEILPKQGFDIILGNPPFKSQSTTAILNQLKDENIKTPDKQIAYQILLLCAKRYLSKNGKLCMIQPYGFLYNTNPAQMRRDFFKNYTVFKILDFISISGLFYDANTKAIAIYLQNKPSDDTHKITHLTFRRTITIDDKICFEIDHYDYHTVVQQDAISKKYYWRANLLGGGRLKSLVSRFNKTTKIGDVVKRNGWFVFEGFMVSTQKNLANFLYNKPLITNDALNNSNIDLANLPKLQEKYFLWPRNKDIYSSPLMIIEKMARLNSGYLKSGSVAYSSESIGIRSNESDRSSLETFFHKFISIQKCLQGFIYLFGNRVLTVRSTAVYERDILNLPWPDDGNFDLVPWENELLDDIRDYIADYVRLGQDSTLLLDNASDIDLDKYTGTFLRLIRKYFKKSEKNHCLSSNGLTLISFTFSGKNELSWLDNSNWEENIRSLINKEQSAVLHTKRIVRILTGNSLIIIKPSKLRYWIRSTAIRDVDDVVDDILHEGRK
ncbi:MAG: N-6 DNA methylase [Treponematales bacterium]